MDAVSAVLVQRAHDPARLTPLVGWSAVAHVAIVLIAVVLYCAGMALFTIVMGNAFAAFPVMAAAIGIPVLINHYGGYAPVIGAVGMLAGFCGTLLTPMAANFNIVPAALLELKSQYGVIRMQAMTAILLFACNILLIYALAFR